MKLPDLAGGLPAALAGKLVVPSAAGAVFSFDPLSGQWGSSPFLPSMEGGSDFRWHVNQSGPHNDVLLFDERPKKSRLFRVGVVQEPTEHLAALAQADTSHRIASPIARTDKAAYWVTASGELVAFELPGLRPRWSRKLYGQVVWGPHAVGSRVMLLVEPQPYDEVHLASGEAIKVQPITVKLPENPRPDERLLVQLLDAPAEIAAKPAASKKAAKAAGTGKTAKTKEKALPPGSRVLLWKDIARIKRFDDLIAESAAYRLVCVDDGQEGPAWSVPWRHGPLSGPPVEQADGGFLIASANGAVVKLSGKGEESGRADLRQPLASGPIPLDERQLAVAGRDGTLHVVSIP